jgi:hypothetical protein
MRSQKEYPTIVGCDRVDEAIKCAIDDEIKDKERCGMTYCNSSGLISNSVRDLLISSFKASFRGFWKKQTENGLPYIFFRRLVASLTATMHYRTSLPFNYLDYSFYGMMLAIGGSHVGWNEGLKAGFGGYVVGLFLVACAQACVSFASSEVASLFPSAGKLAIFQIFSIQLLSPHLA